MKAKWLLVPAAVAIVALYLQNPLGAASEQELAKAKIGKEAPNFTLKDVYDKTFSLSDFKDHIVVLEWINKGCPVSRGCHQRKLMQDTYKKYASKGVVWLAIDTTAGVKAEADRIYAAEQGLAYPILLDPEAKVANAYSAARTPHMFVIDKKGVLAYAGAIDDQGKNNYVAQAIESLLAGKEVAKPKTDAYGCGIKNPKLASGR